MKKHTSWQTHASLKQIKVYTSDAGIWSVNYDQKTKIATVFQKNVLIGSCLVSGFEWEMHRNIRIPSYVIGLVKALTTNDNIDGD